MHINSSYKKKFFKKIEKWDTYLAGELPWSRMWFAPGETYPLHSGCADPSDFSKHGKLGCITCGRGDCIYTFPEGEKMGRRSGCIFFQRGLCDPMDYRMPDFPVPYHLPEFFQVHVYCSVIPSNHPILCHPLFLLPSIFPSTRVFSNELTVCVRLSYYSLLVCKVAAKKLTDNLI